VLPNLPLHQKAPFIFQEIKIFRKAAVGFYDFFLKKKIKFREYDRYREAAINVLSAF
jgi:hypothetical protein